MRRTDFCVQGGDESVEVFLELLELDGERHVRDDHHVWVVFVNRILFLDMLRQIGVLQYFGGFGLAQPVLVEVSHDLL